MMTPELRLFLISTAMGLAGWMAKSLYEATRDQSLSNAKEIGGIRERLAKVETDLDAAHQGLRDLRSQGKESL